ncbi:uncharacterized protein BO80DRAFT_74305 [Aspergillus ibericus CBS 121593]|uniref:Uncharacterized protein n=1 Tax=Aspergillus ibericus CBS 121593 TaxID=1448316 RepID=A0A395HH72_9EURO|nr:hypothetical protein BO80DRAFT_74305 [Aspergillus ibericus CBS 121593]RAL05594.1 hypothetical protein BO80DRAFT_74305 [Aspergillus ibericus CBS 121593]
MRKTAKLNRQALWNPVPLVYGRMCFPKVSPEDAVVALFAPIFRISYFIPSSEVKDASRSTGIEAWVQRCMNGLAIIGPIVGIIIATSIVAVHCADCNDCVGWKRGASVGGIGPLANSDKFSEDPAHCRRLVAALGASPIVRGAPTTFHYSRP